mgnify:CR=1 FL=1
MHSSSVALSVRVAKNLNLRKSLSSFSRVLDVNGFNRGPQRQHVGTYGIYNNVGGTATLPSVGRIAHHNLFDSNRTFLRAFSASAEKVAAQPSAAATSDEDDSGVGTVTFKLGKLDKSVVKKLKMELKEVDANSDER